MSARETGRDVGEMHFYFYFIFIFMIFFLFQVYSASIVFNVRALNQCKHYSKERCFWNVSDPTYFADRDWGSGSAH